MISSTASSPAAPEARHPLFRLSNEDLNMVMAFILVSGSIKALSEQYHVSYPTMRQRLDALIERVRKLTENSAPDPLSDLLADLITKGRLTTDEARQLRDVHRRIVSQPQQQTYASQSDNS